jgi:hypothetical protein|tara:strand:- start:3941 stop:4135 length:195 start_codon:yes stop_codon:yes gene_type:complete
MSVIQSSEETVIGPRVIWEKMLDRAITKYEYSGAYDKFVTDMQRLGFTADQVEDLLTDEEEESN